MNGITLPHDIKQYIRRKAIVYLVKLFLWYVAVVAVNIAIWNYFTNPVTHVIVTVASILLPFLFLGLPKDFLHSTVVGTVTSVHIAEETGSYRAGVRYWPYTKHVIMLDIVTKDGKNLRVKAREYGMRSHQGFAVPFEGDIQLHMNDFAIGDTVYRFRGLPFPFIETQNRKNTEDCMICLSENPADVSACHFCGHTLLKIDRNENQP